MSQEEVRLNRAQSLALARDRNISLIAGAGTGKTEVLSRRFLAIVEGNIDADWTAPEVACPPGGLVAMTYTRKAAGEMRERIARDTGKRIEAARDAQDEATYAYWMRMRRRLKDARITTIHGLCADIVLDHALLLDIDPDATVLEEVDQKVLLDEALDETLRDPPDTIRGDLARLLVASPGREVRKALSALLEDRSFGQAWSQAMAALDVEAFLRRLRRDAAPCTPDEARVRLQAICEMMRPVVTSPLQPSGERSTAFVAYCRDLLDLDLLDDDAALEVYCDLLRRFQDTKGKPYAERSAHHLLGPKKDWARTGDDATGSDLFKKIREEILEDVTGFRGIPGEADRALFRLMRPLALTRDEAERRYTEKKRRRRALDYADLEQLALQVLERQPGVLDDIRRRIRHLMVDEFQDTNETQWRLIRLLASDDPVPTDQAPPWADDHEMGPEAAIDDADGFVSAASMFGLEEEAAAASEVAGPAVVEPDLPVFQPTADPEARLSETPEDVHETPTLGDDRLFIVGDAKQSIYGFRGADVTVYQGSRTALKETNERNETPRRDLRRPDGTPERPRHPDELRGEVELDENFRSLPNLVHFANALFDQVFAPIDGTEHAQYEAAPGPLIPKRPSLEEHTGTVGVLAVPDKPERYETTGRPDRRLLVRLSSKEAQYLRLAQHIDDQIHGDDPLPVYDRQTKRVRPAELCDVAILLPSRTHLKTLERSLASCGLSYVVTGGRGFWSRPEIWDHVNLLSFLADTYRDIALAALLRSPFFAWTDDAVLALTLDDTGRSLWQRLQHAAEDPTWTPPVGFQGATPQEVFAILGAARDAAGATPSHRILQRIHAATGYLAALSSDERPIQARANVAKFVALIRERETRQGIHLPRLVRDLTRRVDEEVDEAEAPIPDDAPGIRILTVHAAKGLEYPIVYLPDLDRPFPTDNLGDAKGYNKGTYSDIPLVTTKVRTQDGDEATPFVHRALAHQAKERARAEQARLLYVAVTRARDHLFLVASTPHLFAERPETARPPARQDAKRWRDWIEDALRLDGASYLDAYDHEGHRQTHTIRGAHYTLDCTPPRYDTTTGAPSARTATAVGEEVPDLSDIDRPLLLPPLVLNPSAVETYRECPARFRHRHIEALPDLHTRGTDLSAPDRGRLLGAAVHRVLEATEDAEMPPTLAARIGGMAREHGFEPEGLLRDVEQHVARARKVLSPLLPTFKEIPFDHAWADGIRTRGVIDHLQRDGDEWLVTDTKSDRPGKDLQGHAHEAGYDAQLAVYRDIVGKLAGPVGAARLVYTSTGETLEVPPDPTIPDLRDRLIATRDADPDDETAWERLWPRVPLHAKMCKACGFHRRYGGPCAGAAGASDDDVLPL